MVVCFQESDGPLLSTCLKKGDTVNSSVLNFMRIGMQERSSPTMNMFLQEIREGMKY